MKNQIKSEAKKALLALYSPDVVKKGMARGERWIKAAYGNAGVEGYQDRLGESGSMDNLVSFFNFYCVEVRDHSDAKHTSNRDQFGIYNPDVRRK